MHGYDSVAVDELLDRVATELDAGRPVAPLIDAVTFPLHHRLSLTKPWERTLFGSSGGYGFAAVDGVLAKLRRQDDPAARTDPWRDLPAWHYGMASRDAGSADLAEPAGRASRGVRDLAAQDYEHASADSWRDFDQPPGTRLSLVKTRMARRELRTAEQHPLASVRLSYGLLIFATAFLVPQTLPPNSLSRDGRAYRLSQLKKVQWPTVAAEICAERPGSPAHLPRTETAPRAGKEAARRPDPAAGKPLRLVRLADRTGQSVLYTHGFHMNRFPYGCVEFPGQRWLQFPVRGTKPSNAIMTAVDQDGMTVARYRIASPSVSTGWRAIEITVHPDQRLTDELILTLALTAPWVSSFFTTVESGGG
jgi:hypothetical protein